MGQCTRIIHEFFREYERRFSKISMVQLAIRYAQKFIDCVKTHRPANAIVHEEQSGDRYRRVYVQVDDVIVRYLFEIKHMKLMEVAYIRMGERSVCAQYINKAGDESYYIDEDDDRRCDYIFDR